MKSLLGRNLGALNKCTIVSGVNLDYAEFVQFIRIVVDLALFTTHIKDGYLGTYAQPNAVLVAS